MSTENQYTGRKVSCIAISSLLHSAVVMGLILYAEKMDQHQPELVQMEVAGAEIPAPPMPAAPPAATAPTRKEEAPAPVMKVKAVTESKPAPEELVEPKVSLKPIVQKAAVPKASVPQQAVTAPVVAEDSDSDVAALPDEDLSLPATPITPAEEPELKTEDVEDSFSKVDQEHEQKVAAIKENLDQDSEKALSHNDEELEKLKAESKEADAKMAKASAGAEASAPVGTQAGFPSGVRNLEDLKQVPGNKKPQYDVEDRFAKRQGEVAFLAYISKEGLPTQLKLMKSSGHRNLDLKSLQAIRNWKFYPGQEGWVEIPISWDLKGGVQERPTPLRRKVSAK